MPAISIPVCCAAGPGTYDQVVARSAFRGRSDPRQPGQLHRFPCGVFVPIIWTPDPDKRRVSAASIFFTLAASAALAAPSARPMSAFAVMWPIAGRALSSADGEAMAGGGKLAGGHQVFLSYSRNDLDAAALLRAQLERAGLSVFKDDESIREGDLWLERLQQAVDACGAFVVLVGRDGVRRWIGAETQVALSRYFGPHDDAERLPIFPILLGETKPETLPAFLRLFQATSWDGAASLPERLARADPRRDRSPPTRSRPSRAARSSASPPTASTRRTCSSAGRRRRWTRSPASSTAAPAIPPVRWLEINGNSGSGKSSLMQAGLLPLVDQGWLWPRTGVRGLDADRPDDARRSTRSRCWPRAWRDAFGARWPTSAAASRRTTSGPAPTGCAAASATTRRHRLSARHRPVRGAVHLRRCRRTAAVRPPARRRARGCRLPAVRDLDGALGLSRPLRRGSAAAGRGAQPAGAAVDAGADRRRRACAR